MKETVRASDLEAETGRSPAHTKTAHSNTSTGLLLKINTV